MEKANIKKYFVTALIMFFTVLIFSILKSMKYAVLISETSAEMISTSILFGVFPSAILFTIIYAKLSDYITRLNIYYILNAFFILFFLIYAFFIYPQAENLSPNLSNIKKDLPFFRYFFSMIEDWCYVIYYIMSELWGNVMILLMFWQIQNQINNINEAKRLYPIFIFIGEMGAITGSFIVSSFHNFAAKNSITWHELFNSITIVIVISGALLALFIWTLGNKVLTKEIINQRYEPKKLEVYQASFLEKVKYVFSSKIFRLIIISVICCGISINLVDGIWKKYLEILYHKPEQILYFTSKVELYRGLLGFITMFISVIIARKFSWKIRALIAPICCFVLALIFAISIYFNSLNLYLASYLAASSMNIIVILGTIQNIITLSTKYAFFDPAKEISYISVEEEIRTKGKAIVEVIGARFGKASGSILQFTLLSCLAGSSLLDITPILISIALISLIIWIWATIALSKEIKNG